MSAVDLEGLERAVGHALRTRDQDGLHVLGYGEISCVIAWPGAEGPWACKRLPMFDREARFDAYRVVFAEYLAALERLGVHVHETRLDSVRAGDDRIAAYCVQPALARDSLGPTRLRTATAEAGRELLATIIGHIRRVVSPRVGIDCQLSNWAVAKGELVYLDVTTPMLRDEQGRDLLDTDLFVASAPAVLRPVFRRFFLDDILDPYFAPRAAARDLLANLHKEGLAGWVPTGISLANEQLGTDLTAAEVKRYYRRDARLWSLIQAMRRLDRRWQRVVRRRPYPFLLPGKIDRKL